MSLALLFPGQGAQEVGMGEKLAKEFPSARNVFRMADEALSFDLTDIMFSGPAEKLQKTEFAQPAILTMGIAFYRVLTEDLGVALKPAFLGGHSLGEYTAHVVAGTFSFAEALSLVHLRGKLMQEAVPVGEGSMAAIMGLAPPEVITLCKEASGEEICEAVNFNAPKQTVISGHAKAVERAVKFALERGAKRALPLNVSAPFHSSLMHHVALRLRDAFVSISWNNPSVPIVSNVTAAPVKTVGEVQNALFLQTDHPVRWSESMAFMRKAGVNTFLELGPGNVLAGLAKRILDRDARILNVRSVEDCLGFQALLEEA
ncbi:MAG TPA: ACP S-malonyltransferase [Synergistaceae bacterium]|nr:ACP S-malonyltransferase [Synergistaceae bacterium]HPQ38179.1 ACP S-malonyltransferase [Synergistaceae bacterium]